MKSRKTKRVSATVVDDVKEETLQGFISDRVKKGSTVYTDGLYEYRGMDYHHEWVNHSVGEYIRGDVGTNGIESFWTGIKRGYKGVYHHWSRQHLQLYISEFVYRQNIRSKDTHEQMQLIAQNFEGKRLQYRDLVSHQYHADRY